MHDTYLGTDNLHTPDQEEIGLGCLETGTDTILLCLIQLPLEALLVSTYESLGYEPDLNTLIRLNRNTVVSF